MRAPPPPANRVATLRARRQLKMAQSAHAFVRGSTQRFYEWIASPAGQNLPSGPDVWICGDCHVGNLGPIGHPEGKTVVELRDLDQTVIGNPIHDVVRLALSLAMAARSSDLPGVTTARMTEDVVAGYELALEGAVPGEHIAELPEPIRVVMKRAMRRTSDGLFDERLGHGIRTIALGRRFWPLADAERAALRALVSHAATRRLVTLLANRRDDCEVRFVDAAFWVKGCSSLGLWRTAVLVELGEPGKRNRKRRSLSLIDVKQAVAPIAPWSPNATPDLSPGQRVLSGARALAPALGARMIAA